MVVAVEAGLDRADLDLNGVAAAIPGLGRGRQGGAEGGDGGRGRGGDKQRLHDLVSDFIGSSPILEPIWPPRL